MEQKYYYRNGNNFLIRKEQIPTDEIPDGYVQITEEEYSEFSATLNSRFRSQIPPQIKQIEELKQQLAQSDYQAIKFAEGWLTAEEYAPIKAHRQSLRDQINSLEAELNG